MRLLAACIVFVAHLSPIEAREGSLRTLAIADGSFVNETNATDATHSTDLEDLANIVLVEEDDMPNEEEEESTSFTQPPPFPINNMCTNAQGPLVVGPRPSPGSPTTMALMGTNVGAIVPELSADLVASCRYSNRPGVWYYVVGDGSIMTASTCSEKTTLDTRLAIFSGSTCNTLTCVTSNDDAGDTTTTTRCLDSRFASRASFPTLPGVKYFIFVSGFASATGVFSLSIEGFNDKRAFAKHVEVGGDGVAGDTTKSKVPMAEELEQCGYSEEDYYGEWYRGPKNRIPRGLWYQVTGTGTRLKAEACAQGTQLHVFDAASGDCVGGGRAPEYYGGGCFHYEWDSSPGVQYDIAVHSLFKDPTFDGDDDCRDGRPNGRICGGPLAPAPFRLTVEEMSDTVSVGRSSHEIFD